MSNVICINSKKDTNFKTFMKENRSKIYAMTPKVDLMSENDEWADETEWDELFKELSTKEN